MWFCNEMGRLGVPDRYVEAFCVCERECVSVEDEERREVSKGKWVSKSERVWVWD